MPNTSPASRKRKVERLGGAFGGLLGSAVKALKGKTKPGKKRKTRQQILDSI